MGVMDEIRLHLSEGKDGRELIGLSYAAGTVYRLQREFRAAQARENALSIETEQELPVPNTEDQSPTPENLQTEDSHNQEQITELRTEVERLANAQAAIGELRESHDHLSDQMQRLDEMVRQQLQQQREYYDVLKLRVDSLTELTKIVGLLLFSR